VLEIQSEPGREFLLAPKGLGRFIGACFLFVWLCGWAVGEGLVLWLLVAGAVALLTGQPPRPGAQALPPGPALAIGGFLLAWLSLWTFGGIAAIRELLRLTIQRDRVIVGPSSLIVVRRFLLFSSRLELPRETIRRIYLAAPKAALSAETTDGSVQLSTLGASEERVQAMSALIAELRLTPADDPATLPGDWAEIVDPEGAAAIVADPRVRRIRVRIATSLAAAASAVAAMTVRGAVEDERQVGLAVLCVSAALAFVWGAVRAARVRDEWRCERGRLTLRRRTGGRVRDLFEAASLELTRTDDSDGDAWYTLTAVAAETSKTLVRAIHDPSEPGRLGRYLAERTGLPFSDRAAAGARTASLEQLKSQLRDSGKLGRLAAGWIERLERRRPSGDSTSTS
jgi:hypothetical protein